MKINNDMLWTAWRMIEKKNSSGGIDDIEIIDFKQNANKNIIQILEKLNNHSYVPQPYLQIKIPKNNTETRTLGLATIMDKIVQQAILNHLEPQIEPSFFENSYAYRADNFTKSTETGKTFDTKSKNGMACQMRYRQLF